MLDTETGIVTLERLVQSMNRVADGDLNVEIPVESSDDLGILAENFNRMTRKTKDLFDRVVQEEANKQRVEYQNLEYEYRFLQWQINPHFIFNTLSSILPLCIKEPEKAYEMLSNFSEYLRGRLYKRELQNTVPVYEEMDLIEAFLSIEQMRFPGLIEYELVNESGENSRILRLSWINTVILRIRRI